VALAYDGGEETESDIMVLELTPLTRMGKLNPRWELFLFSSRFFRHPKHNSAHPAMSTPMNTPIEMPMITPVDKEPLDVGDAGGVGAAGAGAGTGDVVPVPAIHLICSPH